MQMQGAPGVLCKSESWDGWSDDNITNEVAPVGSPLPVSLREWRLSYKEEGRDAISSRG